MSQTSLKNEITPEKALRELWRKGWITNKLHPVQKKMLESYLTQDQEITTIACSRRLGKSFLLCLLASQKCIQTPNAIVKYVCPTKKQVKIVLQPIMQEIFKDCPPELKPEFKYNEYMYVFPNGSQIQMAGTDNGHHETLRGGKSDLWIVDEAGFCDELKYVVNTILAPTGDTTKGRGILASTPSKTSDHEFITEFLQPAEIKGRLIKYTIYDNPMMTPEKIKEIINRFPSGAQDPDFRREYLCEVLNNSDLAIVPEFSKKIEEETVKELVRPPFYDAYVSMDIGNKDLTVVLFGYWDFKNSVLVIEDELVATGNDLLMDRLSNNIRKKEEGLWTNKLSGEFKPPYLRVSDDNNQIMLNELAITHNILFLPTKKDNKDAYINMLRMMVADKQLYINPKCKTLIYHLRNGSWAKNKKTFARSADAGHYDALDSLIYLVRNLHKHKNPYPAGYGSMGKEGFFSPDNQKKYTPTEQAWVNLFKTRKSINLK